MIIKNFILPEPEQTYPLALPHTSPPRYERQQRQDAIVYSIYETRHGLPFHLHFALCQEPDKKYVVLLFVNMQIVHKEISYHKYS